MDVYSGGLAVDCELERELGVTGMATGEVRVESTSGMVSILERC